MSNNTILSVDSSTTKTGWALWNNSNLVNQGVISPKHKDYFDRVYEMYCVIRGMVSDFNVKELVIESPSFVRLNPQSTLKLNQLYGAIRCLCRDVDIKCNIINPKSWKSKLLKAKKRVEQKEEAVNIVNNLYNLGLKKTHDDIADAVLLGRYYNEFHKV